MKKCLYDNCPNIEGTPGIEFHEVFEDDDNNGLPVSKLDCWICSVHLLELEECQEEGERLTQNKDIQKGNGSKAELNQSINNRASAGQKQPLKNQPGGMKMKQITADCQFLPVKPSVSTYSSQAHKRQASTDRKRPLKNQPDSMKINQGTVDCQFLPVKPSVNTYSSQTLKRSIDNQANVELKQPLKNQPDSIKIKHGTVDCQFEPVKPSVNTCSSQALERRASSELKQPLKNQPDGMKMKQGTVDCQFEPVKPSVNTCLSETLKRSIDNQASTELKQPLKNQPDGMKMKQGTVDCQFEPVKPSVNTCLSETLKRSIDNQASTELKQPLKNQPDSMKMKQGTADCQFEPVKPSVNTCSSQTLKLQASAELKRPVKNQPDGMKMKQGTVKKMKPSVNACPSPKKQEAIACCGVACGCTLVENPSVLFFQFPPSSDPRFETWMSFADPSRCGTMQTSWLCSRHFDESQFQDQCHRVLKNDAVPQYKAVSYNSKPLSNLPPHRRAEERPIRSWRFPNIPLAECCAINCPSVNRKDSFINFFEIPLQNMTRNKEWIKAVGGLKTGHDKNAFFICEFHFPERSFHGPGYLLPKSLPVFPFGPLNPRTKDYCPIGKENAYVHIRQDPIKLCSVLGCPTETLSKLPLFQFPSHDKEAFDIWVERININRSYFPDHFIDKYMVVCPQHFSNHCKITERDKNLVTLKFGALPTLFLRKFSNTPCIENSILQKRKIPLSPDDVPTISCMIDESSLIAEVTDLPPPQNRKREFQEIDNDVVNMRYHPNFKNYSKKSRVGELREVLSKMYPSTGENEQNPIIMVEERPAETEHNKSALDLSSLLNSGALRKQIGDEMVGKRQSRKEKSSRKSVATFRSPSGPGVGNEIEIETAEGPRDEPDDVKILSVHSLDPLKGYSVLPMEVSLLKLYNASNAPEKNPFSVLADAGNVPELETPGIGEHAYGSNSSVSIIRSAAKLCEFNEMKIKSLEKLVGATGESTTELETLLAKNLHAVLCYSSVEFLKNCFDKVIQLGIEERKRKTKEGPIQKNPDSQEFERTKKMAVALQAHSGKAYCSLSQYLDLPAPGEARDWATHANGYPGYSEESFRLIRNDLKQLSKKHIVFCLSVLEVPLKKCVQWDGYRIFGHVDLGFGRIVNDLVEEATTAMVFYATSLSDFRKLPLGYCLFADMSAQVRANLITQFIVKLDNVGAKCVAVVADCSVTSFKVFKELGAISETDQTTNMGVFLHPVNRHSRIYCFVDTAQLMRSVNTMWLEKRILRSKEGKIIDYSVLEKMEKVLKNQPEDLFNWPTHKSPFHKIFTDLATMMTRVPKESPVYYKYCAVALSVFRNAMSWSDFSDSSETIKFLVNLSFINELFSSCHPFGEGDRKPITNKLWLSEAARLATVFNYFAGLTSDSGDRIMLSERRMLVTLICLNIASLRNLTRRVVSDQGRLKVPVVYSLALTLNNVQQFVDTLIGTNRTCTPLEFKNAYKEYLGKLSLKPSDVLIPMKKPIEQNNEVTGVGYELSFVYAFKPLSSVSDMVSVFLAENAIDSWLQSTQCTDCSQMVQNELTKYQSGDRVGNLIHDIVALLQQAERVLSEHDDPPCHDFDSIFLLVSNQTLNSLRSLAGFLNQGHLFNSVCFGEVSHFTVLAKGVMRAFLKMRLTYLPRQESIKINEPRGYALKFRIGRSWT